MRILVSRIAWLVTIVSVVAMTGLHAQQTPSTSPVLTPVPRVMWLSGVFRPATGPVAPLESVTVAIYRERDGGDVLWHETQPVAMEAGGRYNLLMGSTVADGLPLELFASGEPRWIGITINRPGEVEQPRVPLASVPYALKAADADTLGGLPASAYLLSERKSSPSTAGASPRASTSDAPSGSEASSGNPGYLGMFVNSTDLGNSALFQNGSAIGLGTTTPRDVFHVTFNNGSGGNTGLAVQNLSAALNAYSGTLFYDQNGTLGLFQGFSNATHEYRINNVAAGGIISFRIAGSTKLLVANNGNIGIGAVPASKLDVAGDINTTTKYSIGGSGVLSVPGTNTFAGVNAGELSTGDNNAFFGRIAGRNNTGSFNAFFGDGIGQNNTGNENAFFGDDAGLNNASGARNSFLGKGAGSGNEHGANNTFVGFQAGINNTGCCNAFFGSFSGNHVFPGANSTLIGFGTEFGAPLLTNATAIGYRAMVSQSNSLILGSIDSLNGATADTNVGIGTPTPKTRLHVAGGSIYIAQPNSLVITSPNGNCWFITVNDAGTLGSISVPCP